MRAAAALCVLFLTCSLGCPGASAPGTDAGAEEAESLRIDLFEVAAIPLENEIEIRWASAGADRCALEESKGAFVAPFDLAASGMARFAADFEAADHLLELTLKCERGAAEASVATSLQVPHIVAFTPEPRGLAQAGDEVTLCWRLDGGVDPVCAIFAMTEGAYYYPLEASGCLFPLTITETSTYLLYCSPTNGYVERTLTVEIAR